MQRFIIILLLIFPLAVGLAGCAGAEQARAGRRAFAAGDAQAAMRHFETVLGLQPWRGEDDRFMEEVRLARRDAAVAEGNEAMDRRQASAAIVHFRRALDLEPDHPPAADGLDRALRAAADMHFQIALQRADRGDAEAARASLTAALEHHPDHSDAQAALDSFERPDPRSADQMAAAQELAAQRRWPEAAERFQAIRQAVPEHLQARLALAHARRQIELTQQLLAEASDYADERQLERAIETLRQALEISPHDPAVAEMLGWVSARRAEAQRHSDLGAEHLAGRRWDAAIAAAQAALEIFPFDPAAVRVIADARAGAAAQHHGRGAAWLAEGRLDEADAAFRDALRYQPRHGLALRGLADSAIARADLFEREGRLGHALLWHMRARDHVPGHSGPAELRRRIGLEHAIAPLLEVSGSGPGITADAAAFLAPLTARLDRAAPPFVMFHDAGALPEGAWRPLVVVEVADVDISRYVSGTSSHVHRYRVQRPVPNPQIPRLHQLLHQQHRELERLQRLERRQRDEFENARAAAAGSEDPAALRRVRNLRRTWEQTASRLRQQERRHRSLSDDLRRAPAQVIEEYDQSWPYVVVTHRVEGRLAVRVSIADGERPLGPTAVIQKQFVTDDTTIDPSNPGIGLHPKNLNLPDDGFVRQQLLVPAAEEAAGHILRQIVGTQVAGLEARATALHGAEATEARIRAAVLLESIDPSGGRRRLAELAREVR